MKRLALLALALLALVPTLLFAQAGSGQPVPVGSGGTGATNPSAARINLGLGNVNNTSDANKPVSIATQAALDLKESSAGAQAKADAAQAAAIATAATDATTKANAAQAAAIAASLPASYLDTDATMAANSNAKVPSQAAVRAYVAANSTAAFSGLTGQPTDNSNLATALNAKQPLPSYASLASDALTLGHDNIIRTATLAGTKNLTLSSGGSTGDWRQLSFDMPGATRTVTTDFAVYRNGASSPATISQDFTDHADITIINMGGVYRWYDNLYGAQDQPVGSTPANYTPAADNTKAHLAAIDNALGVLGSTITGIDSAPIGTGQLWTTSDLANRPANWLVADGTNGTPAGGTVGGMTSIIKGGGTVAPPAVSNGIVAGTYTGTQSVAVSSATPGASLYYTFGSSPTDPTTSDTAVSGNISVAATGTLKVKAFKNLYTPSSVFSAAYTINPAFTYLLSDDLVYTSLGAATTGGWTTTAGAPTWNYATSPAPLGGLAKSLKVTWGDATKHPFTASADVWFYFLVNVPTMPGASSRIVSVGDGTNILAKVTVTSAGIMQIGYGATGAGSVDLAFTPGTTYHCWLRYVKGTGANANIVFHRSTDGVKGSALANIVMGTGVADAIDITLQCASNATAIFNKLRVSTTSIGDNPL